MHSLQIKPVIGERKQWSLATPIAQSKRREDGECIVKLGLAHTLLDLVICWPGKMPTRPNIIFTLIGHIGCEAHVGTTPKSP